MELLKIFAVLVASVVLGQIIKQYNPSFAAVFAVGVSVLVLLYIIYSLLPYVAVLQNLFSATVSTDFTAIAKAVGIGIVTEVVSGICEDADQKALAAKAVLAGKLAILVVALPLFEQVFSIITELLK